jgi:Holliday junction resolvase RusA-like endonuclease
MIIKIPMLCRSKKNSQKIVINSRTKRPIIIQSDLYKQFEKDCGYYLTKYKGLNIDKPINLKCTFIVPDRKKRDIVNLLNAIQDILVKYQVIADDNYNIVQGIDGSRIIYKKGISETIIEIKGV